MAERRLGRGRVVIVAGSPGSGKGTQCKKLASAYGLVHLSTGDIFRDQVERGSQLGKQAQEYLDGGSFVPDDMVIALVLERLDEPDVREFGCLLDGFPRTADQAQALLAHSRVDAVVWLEVPAEVAVQRVAHRRIDPETGDVYNLEHVPPPPEIVPRLVRRDRDDEESFRQRIRVYEGQRQLVFPFFQDQVYSFDSNLEPDVVFQNIARALEDRCRNDAASDVDGDDAVSAPPLQFSVGQGEVAAVASGALETPAGVGWGEDGGSEWSADANDKDVAAADGVSIVVAPCHPMPAEGGETHIMVSVQVPDLIERGPVDIVCVIDVSGSMGIEATYEKDGERKGDGLSVLDIVKHSVKTVIKALQEGDRLALVSFNQAAQTVLGLTPMDAAGQDRALAALDLLEDEGQTNIWAGILAAMDALREGLAQGGAGQAGRHQAVMLLTDGQPNVAPPRGHVTEMRAYLDAHVGFTFQLNTFGFGYDLDSELLLELATEGNGTYAFIPDAVIVGTTFVNSVANILSTLSQSATLNVMPLAGAELAGPVLGGFAELDESWGRIVNLGPLQHGQSREVVLPVRVPDQAAAYLEIVLTYSSYSGRRGRVSAEARSREVPPEASLALCRADMVSTGYAAVAKAVKNQGKQAGQDVAALNLRLEAAVGGNGGDVDGRLTVLKADAGGRMSKALQGKDRFNRWGKHYLRALMRAHQVQLCTNFMDAGLQPYGGALFRALREAGDKIFLSLPAPVKKVPSWAAQYLPPEPVRQPQRPAPAQRAAGQRPRTPTPPQSPRMDAYYGGSGGG